MCPLFIRKIGIARLFVITLICFQRSKGSKWSLQEEKKNEDLVGLFQSSLVLPQDSLHTLSK